MTELTNDTSIPNPDSRSLQSWLFFWVGQLTSILGSSIVQFSIIWWITITYKSAIYLSIAFLLGFGSTIAVSLFAGVFVDRWSRKKIIATVDSIEALITLGLIYLFWIGEATIVHVLIVITIRGVMQGFHETAIFAIMPLLVPKEKLTKINGWNYLATGLIFLVGPVIGAILLGIFGVENLHVILWIDAITFAIAVVPLIIIHIPSVKSQKPEIEKPSFKSEFSEGITFIKKKKGLLSLLSAFTSANFFGVGLFILLPLVVVQQDIIVRISVDIPLFINDQSWSIRSSTQEASLAILMAMMQIGSILGSVLMSSITLFKKNTTGVAVGLFSMGVGIVFVGIGASFVIIPIILLGMFINGFSLPIANVASQTIWQTVVPNELQGRVFSVRRTIAQVSSPIAMVLTGIVAEFLGSVAWIIFTGVGSIVMMAYIWSFTSFTNVESMLEFSDVELPKVEEEVTEADQVPMSSTQ
ncbi:MAG: MFS transporter [Candidatus Kariarchaeaceae archaeon]|jgi:DHA3 family macrolide efflux protein-like MFS transporter